MNENEKKEGKYPPFVLVIVCFNLVMQNAWSSLPFSFGG